MNGDPRDSIRATSKLAMGGPSEPNSRLSLLAVFGMVLAVMVCLPPVCLVGSVLGAIASQKIAQSGGTLRGRRLARTASIVGLCLGLVGFIAFWRLSVTMQQWMLDSAQRTSIEFVRQVQEGKAATARDLWVNDSTFTLTDEQLNQFGRTITERFGAIRRFSVSSMTPSPIARAGTFDVVGLMTFERAERPAALEVALVPSIAYLLPNMRIRRIAIDDVEQGDLMLPEAADQTATSHPSPTS